MHDFVSAYVFGSISYQRCNFICFVKKTLFDRYLHESEESMIVTANGYKRKNIYIWSHVNRPWLFPQGNLEHKSHQKVAFTWRQCGWPFVFLYNSFLTAGCPWQGKGVSWVRKFFSVKTRLLIKGKIFSH